MRRASAVAALSILLVTMPLSGSSAGGGNWIDFDRPLSVGDPIVGKNRYFDRGDVTSPPYYAYLIRGPVNGFPVPLRLHKNAIVLGKAEITWPGPNTGWTGTMRNNPLLRIEATVPDVAPGNYVVSICNRPCTDLIEEVHPTSVTIYGSALEARLTQRISTLESRVIQLQYDARRANRQAERRLERDLEDTSDGLNRSVDALNREMTALETGLNADSFPWAQITLAALVALALGLGGGMLAGRRQRLPVDWDQLLEEARRSETTRT